MHSAHPSHRGVHGCRGVWVGSCSGDFSVWPMRSVAAQGDYCASACWPRPSCLMKTCWFWWKISDFNIHIPQTSLDLAQTCANRIDRSQWIIAFPFQASSSVSTAMSYQHIQDSGLPAKRSHGSGSKFQSSGHTGFGTSFSNWDETVGVWWLLQSRTSSKSAKILSRSSDL